LEDAANAAQHQDCLAALDLALEQLGSVAGAAAAAAGVPPELARALKARLGFRRAFHQGLVRLQKKGAEDLAAAARHFKAALAELALVKETAAAGAAAGAAAEAAAGQQQQLLGFVEDVNSGLLPAAPPRQVEVRGVAAGAAPRARWRPCQGPAPGPHVSAGRARAPQPSRARRWP
jgi:hypothetical protein